MTSIVLLSPLATMKNRTSKHIHIGFVVALFLANATTITNADTIQISNLTLPEYPVASYSAVLDANADNLGTTLGYDPGIDHDLDTSTNPYEYAMVAYAELAGKQGGLHVVDYNFASELDVGDTYTFRLGFENGTGIDIYNLENFLLLIDFQIGNSQGVRDYQYALSINTDGLGNTYEYTTSGLLSDVWATPDKKLGEWEQDLLAGMDWRRGRAYGELIITAKSVPEPHAIVLVVGAVIVGVGLVASRK